MGGRAAALTRWALLDAGAVAAACAVAAGAVLSPSLEFVVPVPVLWGGFPVSWRGFYAVTAVGALSVVGLLFVATWLRGPREAPFLVGFSLVMFDATNSLAFLSAPRWSLEYTVAIVCVWATLLLAPLAVGLRPRLNTLALPAFFATYVFVDLGLLPFIRVGRFHLDGYPMLEPFMLALALAAALKILPGRKP